MFASLSAAMFSGFLTRAILERTYPGGRRRTHLENPLLFLRGEVRQWKRQRWTPPQPDRGKRSRRRRDHVPLEEAGCPFELCDDFHQDHHRERVRQFDHDNCLAVSPLLFCLFFRKRQTGLLKWLAPPLAARLQATAFLQLECGHGTIAAKTIAEKAVKTGLRNITKYSAPRSSSTLRKVPANRKYLRMGMK